MILENLAELYSLMGKEEKAKDLQKRIELINAKYE